MHEKILLVDDDVSILLLVSDVLEEKGLEVTAVRSGEEALRRVEEGRFDLILLDIMMKGLSGLEVCRQIRGRVDCPILFLSAKDSVKDIVKGLDLGADDYLTKPFSVEELLARLRVTQRRLAALQAGTANGEAVFTNGKLKVDYAAGCAFLGGQELHLTPSEYKLLCLLCKNVGKVLTYTFITQQIWGRSWENDVASLRVFMATLRKKLEQELGSPQYIQTHIGVGYRMMKVE